MTGKWLIPTTGNVKAEDALRLIDQALFLGDQKRFDDAMICLQRASEASPELNDEISVCRASLILEREYSTILKNANEWLDGASLSRQKSNPAPLSVDRRRRFRQVNPRMRIS